MVILIAIIAYILYKDYVIERKKQAGQPSIPNSLVVSAQHPDRTRLYVVGTFIAGIYAIIMTWLNFAWYRLYDRSGFHWFDDRGEWIQVDKAGHIFGAYFETVWAYELLRWTGMDNKRAAITAAFIGMGFESSIEVWDGFSTKWGASWSDLAANFIGASLALTQYLLWEEQRIMCKFSYNGNEYKYTDPELKERADDLFGRTFFEKVVKDYNNITLWVSVNPSKFIPAIKPDWMCLSIGYKGENLFGGYENKWTDKEGKQHDRSDLPRLRVLKLSLDADLPRLRKNDPEGKAAFKALNIFKMPFPSYKIKI
jgi:hypothetical protein